MDNRTKGMFYVIASAFIFGCMPLGAKIAYSGGNNALSLVFYRSFFALPGLLFLQWQRKETLSISKKQLFQIILLVVAGMASTPMLLFSSYNYIPSGIATTLHFVYPIFVLLGCALFFKEKITPVKALCVAACTIGIAFLGKSDGEIHLLGLSLAFLSGITFAFYMIYLGKSGLTQMHPFKLGIYMALVSCVFSLAVTVPTGTFVWKMTPMGYLFTILFANVVTIVAVVLLQIGIRSVGPQTASILSTFEPATSILVGIFFLNEPFTFATGIGFALILLSVTALTLLESASS